ncbi:vWA domain-containing protein [Rubellicoccus peritrichatus]|uniref:VWA domain-containing protein n=1 Tax=Rubellicoccus peritrichatus TaxID=3080537 RepID=A0AAQ3L951_9BACT|nr:vWA domain-containing protein [Puniceicoccus sp. CR14]WOO41376.1 vWA domain-containing protein [Puniceicoccus sp. CR14]
MTKYKKLNLPLLEVIGISALVHIVGLVVLGGIIVTNAMKEPPAEFSAPPVAKPIEQVKVRLQTQLEKTRPPVNMPKLTVKNPSQMNMPQLDIALPETTDRVGFGNSFGTGGLGSSGLDLGKMSVDFFGLGDSAERIIFVVDYSLSMKEKAGKVTREVLMKDELTRSIEQLPSSTMIGMVFFSGPVWQPGDDPKKTKERYVQKSKDWHDFALAEGERIKSPKWITLKSSNKRKLVRQIEEEKLTGGTTWSLPLEVAFAAKPIPEVIFFLTDGATSPEDVERALELTAEYHKKHPSVKVNAIALGEPKAEKGLKRIAQMTGGQFRLVDTIDRKHTN